MKIKAVSLIEILVVLGIMVLFLAIAIPAYGVFERRNALNLNTQKVKDSILEAKNYALAPRTEKPDTVNNYLIYFAPDGDMNKYEIGEGDPNNPQDPKNYSVIVTRDLPSNITFSNRCWIKFSVSGQGGIPAIATNPNQCTPANSGACCYNANRSDSGISGNVLTIPVQHTENQEYKYIKINLSTGETRIE